MYVPTDEVEESADEQVGYFRHDLCETERLPRVELCFFLTSLKDVSVGNELGLGLGNDSGWGSVWRGVAGGV